MPLAPLQARAPSLPFTVMGSVGRDYRCPLCGRRDDGAYAFDHVGFPTCVTCNFRDGLRSPQELQGCWWAPLRHGISEGDTAYQIRARQLRTILAPNVLCLPCFPLQQDSVVFVIAAFLLPR